MTNNKTVEAILSHMNADHKLSLYDYLAHYKGVKLDLNNTKHSVELVDVKLDRLTLNYKDETGPLKSTVINLQPPMRDITEARNRLVAMALEAADALHKSPYQVTSYAFPTHKADKISLVVTSLAVAFLAGARLSPTFFTKISEYSPFLARIASKLFFPILAIHFLEYLLKVVPMLKRQRAPLSLYLIYLIPTVAVGIPSWRPLDRKLKALAKERAEFEKGK